MNSPAFTFLSLFMLIALAVLAATAVLVGSGLILPKWKPRRPRPEKLSTYECGVPELQPGARRRYSVKFYLVAVLFILFDVELAFLLPWAVQYRHNVWTFLPFLLFVGTLLVGYIYVWGKGALDWER